MFYTYLHFSGVSIIDWNLVSMDLGYFHLEVELERWSMESVDSYTRKRMVEDWFRF